MLQLPREASNPRERASGFSKHPFHRPQLHLQPRILNFVFHADPDPAFQKNADPCGSESATVQIDTVTDSKS